MLDAVTKALSQILSPPMRSILWKSVGLALVLIVVVAIALQRLLSWLAGAGALWTEGMVGSDYHTFINILLWFVSIAAGLGIVLGAVFLMPAITSLVASVFVDDVADIVEREHYPAEKPGVALPVGRAIIEGSKTALLTVEGERDDICALGQTAVAHDLCSSLKPHLKRHHMQAGVGHYGVFSGKRWEGQIYPIVRNMILASD